MTAPPPPDLPGGWRTLPFDSCALTDGIERRASIQKSAYKPTGRFPIIDQGAAPIAGYTDDDSVVHSNDLPLILFGDHTRILKFLDFPFATGADGTKLLRAHENVVDPKFLYYALRRLEIPSRGYSRHFDYIRDTLIPVPETREEQRRIAAILSAIERSITLHGRLVTALKTLKAATIAKLFWEGLRGEPLKQTEIGEVPQSWQVVPIGEHCDPPRYGHTETARRDPVGPKFLRITDIQERGVDWDSVPYCRCPEHIVAELRLKPGDLVFARIGATTGKSYLITSCPDAVFASYLIRLRAGAGLDPSYLSCFFESDGYRLQIRANKGTNLKGGMSASVLASLLLPLPPLAEQVGIAKIVKAIDRSALAAARRGNLLKTVFSSMLHLLMTGQVRVKPEVVTMRQQRQTPSSARTPRVGRAPDPRIVQTIVDRIVAAVAPEKIILFGSAARGEMGPDSDIDLLVVKACDAPREMERRIYRGLIGIGIPKDVLVVTPGHLEKHKDTIGYIYRPALREGRVIYAR